MGSVNCGGLLKRSRERKVTQSCPTLCNPMGRSLPGSCVHGILQARVLEWVAISFSRGSSRPRDRTWVSRTPGRRVTIWATREALKKGSITDLLRKDRKWNQVRCANETDADQLWMDAVNFWRTTEKEYNWSAKKGQKVKSTEMRKWNQRSLKSRNKTEAASGKQLQT